MGRYGAASFAEKAADEQWQRKDRVAPQQKGPCQRDNHTFRLSSSSRQASTPGPPTP